MFFRIGQFFRVFVCVLPQSDINRCSLIYRNERTSLRTSKKGSLTVETALIVPFFLMILLAFFSFFDRYAKGAELKAEAAARAKKVGIAAAGMGGNASADVRIFKSAKLHALWIDPFETEREITQSAVCRRWIGFTELEEEETYVYLTPEGNVYHLYRDCTHLQLSVRLVTFVNAEQSRNEYGERYRECQICDSDFGALVYITSEGNRYHSERSCSGLKRTVRQVPLREAAGRACCIRCLSEEE